MDKRALRKMVRARLSAVSMEERVERSARISAELDACLSASDARVVALFSPLPDEPQIWKFVECLSARCLVTLPRVEGDVMRFYRYGVAGMEKGAFGIMEPSDAELVEPGDIDVIVVPGVAFSLSGVRTGRGKGYYDKYMSQPGFRALKIGVCFKEQIMDGLLPDPHDVPVDTVVCG